MVKTVSKYADKHKNILSVARRLFLQDGYKNTSMDQVAAESGVTKQTVYRYFPSKLALLEEVLKETAEENPGYQFGDSMAESELLSFAVHFVELHLTDDRIGIYRLTVSESDEFKEIADALNRVSQSARRQSLADFISHKLTTENPVKDAELLISMLLSIRNKVLLGHEPKPTTSEVWKHCSYVVSLFLHGRNTR